MRGAKHCLGVPARLRGTTTVGPYVIWTDPEVPRTHRYHVTGTARAIRVAVLAAARASVNQVNQLPKAV
ncbi:MAG: hypothetical protein ACLQU1_11365 [Bryobacteraceae bacterium]